VPRRSRWSTPPDERPWPERHGLLGLSLAVCALSGRCAGRDASAARDVTIRSRRNRMPAFAVLSDELTFLLKGVTMNCRPLFTLPYVPFAIAALAVTGCSNAPGLPANAPSTGAAGTYSATPLSSSSSASQDAATHSAGALAPLRLLYAAPGQWIEPGEQMKVSGIGCKPDSEYTVTEGSLHSTGRVLATGQTTASGRFLATVTVRSTGEPSAVLGVTCDNSAGNTIEPYQTDLTFIPSVGARPTVHQGTKIPFTGGSGCRPGSIVQAVVGDHAEGYRVIGQSAASGSGAFSVEARIPALSAGVHDVFVACQWSAESEPFYPAYMQVIFASSGPA
jgi:hypothetical protein